MNFHRTSRYLSIALLIASVMALLFAPTLMPASYDWIKHTTSESAAQGIKGAWLARTGFVMYGLAVSLLVINKHSWTLVTRIIHFVFAVSMMGNAIFSSKPWDPSLPFNVFEDTLHSWMSGLVGTAFTLGVMCMLFQRSAADWFSRVFDSLAILFSVSVTLIMFSSGEDIAGLVQRIMFGVSYLWFAKELIKKRSVV